MRLVRVEAGIVFPCVRIRGVASFRDHQQEIAMPKKPVVTVDPIIDLTVATPTLAPDDLVVEHIARMWDAATQNAERVSSRIQLLAGVVGGLLSLIIFGFTWTYDVPSAPMLPWWPTIIIHVLLSGTVGLLCLALLRLYVKTARLPLAADKMELDATEIPSADALRIAELIYAAYANLKDRNDKERQRLASAEVLTGWAVVLVVVAGMIHLWASLPAKLHPKDDSNDNANRATVIANTRGSDPADHGSDNAASRPVGTRPGNK